MVWYFAYGSNMSEAVSRERRGMRPLDGAMPERLVSARHAQLLHSEPVMLISVWPVLPYASVKAL